MEKIKKVLICMICLIILLAIIIILMTMMAKNEEPNDDDLSIIQNDNIDISLVKDASEYYTIERVVKQYSTYLNYLNINVDQMMVNITDKESREKISKEYLEKGENLLKNVLVSNYLENSNWENNILKYSNKELSINEMKKCYFNNMDIYLVNVNFGEDETAIVIIYDEANNTFSILPSEYLSTEKINQENLLSVLKELNINAIEKNDNNEVKKLVLTDEQISIKYFNDYKNLLSDDIEKLYNRLDEQYRERCFGSLENFQQYVNSNKDSLNNSTLSKYQVNTKDDYIQYICLDENGNYYIFNATAVMQYDLFLDTYTIESEEFLTKYNNGDEKTKAGMNVEKFFEALNRKDYTYIYEHLADSFKNNSYQKQEDFEKYIKENLFEYNDKKYTNYEQEGNLHVFKISVSDKENEEQKKTMTIIIQLKEGTDFVMSFSIE